MYLLLELMFSLYIYIKIEMGCSCKNKKKSSVKSYKKKHLGYRNVSLNKPTKTKEQLRLELIARIRRIK
jgi:hypothetical protein